MNLWNYVPAPRIGLEMYTCCWHLNWGFVCSNASTECSHSAFGAKVRCSDLKAKIYQGLALPLQSQMIMV